MILVTGATGKFGGSTADFLIQKNIPFRAAAQHPEKLDSRFGDPIERVAFDWYQPDSFTNVLKGIRTISLMPPPLVNNDFHLIAKPFILAAANAGVQHIVLTTALYSDEPDSLFYETEALIKNSGIDFTIIRPSFVFQNFLIQFLEQVKNGVIVAPSETGKTSYVDIRNVGEATALVLAKPADHKGKTYSITGSEALSHRQMAKIFSEELSRQVVHISPSHEEYKKGLAAANVPFFVHEFLVILYSSIAKGQWKEVSNDYTVLTGKRPVTFKEFVHEYREAFNKKP
jgi:uncharacterized protein YbjT (DUF2867 family)